MEDTITTHYCLCEEFLKASGHRDDPQCRLSTAEVMTIALTAAAFFAGNIERSRTFLHEHGYMRAMISKSRLNRRLHAIAPHVWESLFAILASAFKEGNPSSEYAVDSFPVAVCQNCRISRSRIYGGDGALRGRAASAGGGWFYGLRVHMLVGAERGEPVEFYLEPGSANDNPPFKGFALDLAEGSGRLRRQAVQRLPLRGSPEGGGVHRDDAAQEEELQASVRRVCGVHPEEEAQARGDYLQPDRGALSEKHPRGEGGGLRVEDRLLHTGVRHPIPIGGNLGYLRQEKTRTPG